MTTTILSELTVAKASRHTSEPINPAAIAGAVHLELAPGAFLNVVLRNDGLWITNGNINVVVPLTELARLAIASTPGLTPEPMQEINSSVLPPRNIVPLRNA